MTKTFGMPAFAGTSFEFLSFGFVSDFDIRISNLFLTTHYIRKEKILREGY